MTTPAIDADRTPDEPSDGIRTSARRAIAEQPVSTVTVLSSLLAVQDEIGYLPPEAIDEVAIHTGHSTNEVWGVAYFYPNFRFTPPGRHTVEICWGPTCHVLGAQTILQGLLEHLNLEHEGESEDGSVSFKMNTCLGVCPHAPAMSFDHVLAGKMDLAQALRRVEEIRQEDHEQDHQNPYASGKTS